MLNDPFGSFYLRKGEEVNKTYHVSPLYSHGAAYFLKGLQQNGTVSDLLPMIPERLQKYTLLSKKLQSW